MDLADQAGFTQSSPGIWRQQTKHAQPLQAHRIQDKPSLRLFPPLQSHRIAVTQTDRALQPAGPKQRSRSGPCGPAPRLQLHGQWPLSRPCGFGGVQVATCKVPSRLCPYDAISSWFLYCFIGGQTQSQDSGVRGEWVRG